MELTKALNRLNDLFLIIDGRKLTQDITVFQEDKGALQTIKQHLEQALRLGGRLPSRMKQGDLIFGVDVTNPEYDKVIKWYNQCLDQVQSILPALIAEEVKGKMLTKEELEKIFDNNRGWGDDCSFTYVKECIDEIISEQSKKAGGE